MRSGGSRLAGLLAWALAGLAHAANYEVPTDSIQTESDITDMEERGDISSATADTLLDLFRAGVDINGASRDELYDLPGLTYDDADGIILYRQARGHINDPVELVAAGVLTEEKLLNIAAFISIEPTRRLPFGGSVRLISAASNGDFLDPSGYQGPPSIFMGRLKLPLELSAGLYLMTTRRLPGSPRYDDLRDELVVDPFAYRLNLINSFVQWKGVSSRVVLGTYDIGFAERLTFDTTRRFEPDGITLTEYYRRPITASRECRLSGNSELDPCTVGDKDVYLTPDFNIRQPLRGLAASVEDLELGAARLSLYGWLSYQTRNIYQYEIYDQRTCDDPRDDSVAGCSAPSVYVVHGNDLTQDARLTFTTLPALYEELLGGARAEVAFLDRWRVGVTGYGANNYWHGKPLELDTQEWSHTPFGGPFGAVGVDARGLLGRFTVFLEATRSFDSIPNPPVGANPLTPNGGGGFGVEQRTVYNTRGNELEVSLRYYDVKFVNPYARPPSAPDEFDGQRARNELGLRARYMGKLPQDLELRARADFWVNPYGSPTEGPAGTANLYGLVRLGWLRLDRFRPAVWVDVRNRNLASSTHGGCSSEYVPTTAGDNTFDCSGDLYRLAARADFVLVPRWLEGAVQSFVTWLDDPHYKDRFRQDFMMWGELTSRLTDWARVRVRTKYLHQDVSTDNYLEQSLWSWLELVLTPNRQIEALLRYDVYWYLDKRTTTLSRVPNPEHRFFLDFTYKF